MIGDELQGKMIEMLPVVVGGLIAIVGSVSVNLFSHILESKRSRRKIFAEKSERLVEVLFKNMSWLVMQYSETLTGSSRPENPEYIHVAQMLQSIYFPHLREDMYSISCIHCNLYEIIGGMYKSLLSDKLYIPSSEDAGLFENLLKEYKDRLLSITEQCRQHTIA